MNRTVTRGTTFNQLDDWNTRGFFTQNAGAASGHVSYPDLNDPNAPLDDRARAYLAVNCSMCHQANGPTPANLDLRYGISQSLMNAFGVAPSFGTLGLPNAEIIKLHERELLALIVAGDCPVQERTMVEARLDDGQCLLALNELFVGHCSHQSARYRLSIDGNEERQSSSGLIIATGTGATGWARSIHESRHSSVSLPDPTDGELIYFVREAFPSIATGTELTEGRLHADDSLSIVSEMDTGGVVFGDTLGPTYRSPCGHDAPVSRWVAR